MKRYLCLTYNLHNIPVGLTKKSRDNVQEIQRKFGHISTCIANGSLVRSTTSRYGQKLKSSSISSVKPSHLLNASSGNAEKTSTLQARIRELKMEVDTLEEEFKNLKGEDEV